MQNLERRLKSLEDAPRPNARVCFWCMCERDREDAAPEPSHCTHRDWQAIAHETALDELE